MKQGHGFRIILAISALAILAVTATVGVKFTLAQHTGHTPAPVPGKGAYKPGMEAAPPGGAQEEAPIVEITPEQQKIIGVKTSVATMKPLRKVVRTVGRIQYDETRLSTINTKIEGWIEKLHVTYAGQYVKKGAPIADIFSPELYATQQEYLNILAWTKSRQGESASGDIGKMLAKDASDLLQGSRQRLQLWDISAEQIRRMEKTGKPIRTLTLYSPVSGYIIQKNAVLGTRVMAGEKLFDVADLSSVWVIADIYEYELPLIKTGQPAKIALSYLPGKEFTSRIDYIFPALSSETRTAKVRFVIANTGLQLKPQMFTNVEIKVDLGKRLTVPEAAIMDTGRGQIAYVDKGDGYFEPRAVMVGVRADGLAEVVRGLKAGEKVASSANFLIDSEAQLKGVTGPSTSR